MGEDALWAVVQRLQTGLQAREKQLERQGQQLSDMHQVQQQLQVGCRTQLTLCVVQVMYIRSNGIDRNSP